MPKARRSKPLSSGAKRAAGKSGSRAKRASVGKGPADGRGLEENAKAAAAEGKRLARSVTSRKAVSTAKAAVKGTKADRRAAVKEAKAAKGASRKMKTSVYLERAQARRLARLSEELGRPQSEIIREAIETYEPPRHGDRNFALARGFDRIDEDPRPISEIGESELLGGLGG